MTDPTPPETSPEPSMEEILASIRQIISEDLASVSATESHPAPEGSDARDSGARDSGPWGSGARGSGVRAEDDDVLILTDPAPPEASPFAPPPEAHADAQVDPHIAETPPAEPVAREPDFDQGRSLALAPSVLPAVVAPETAAVVAASFERLTFVVENTPPPPPFAVSAGGATLEDITREILTPVIKAWLDENLPSIVQARVDEEVERITRGRVR
jgi:uncharacterized protein